jgi:hypothetical protein
MNDTDRAMVVEEFVAGESKVLVTTGTHVTPFVGDLSLSFIIVAG